MNQKSNKIIDPNNRGFNTEKSIPYARSTPFVTHLLVALVIAVSLTVSQLARADQNNAKKLGSLDAREITGSVVIISIGPDASEPLAPLQLLENGVVGGTDAVAPKLTHAPLPGVTFTSNIHASSWSVTDRGLVIEWTANCSGTLPGGSVKVTIKYEVTLNPQTNDVLWVGTARCQISSNTGQNHDETLPSKANLVQNTLLEKAGEEAMQGGATAFRESKLKDMEKAVVAEESIAKKLREQATNDQDAVTDQMKRVEAAERDARATAAAGVDDPRQVGEATMKFEALESEKSKLAEAKKTASQSNELANLAEQKASKSRSNFELAKTNWNKLGKYLGALGPAGELFEGDRRRQELKAEGKYLSVWVNTFETLGAVTGSTVTYLGTLGFGPFRGQFNPVGQFLGEFAFEEWSRQVGKAIGQATGKWTGLQDAPGNVNVEK